MFATAHPLAGELSSRASAMTEGAVLKTRQTYPLPLASLTTSPERGGGVRLR